MKEGSFFVCEDCPNLIREIEGYVWHPKCKEKGEDEPLKLNDHAIDAMRYALNTHIPSNFNQDEYKKRQENQWKQQQNWKHPNEFGFR